MSPKRRARTLWTCVSLTLVMGLGATEAVRAQDDRGAPHVLFVGNSLTYGNALPDMVRTVAEALGRNVVVDAVTRPNVSLEDHWYAGIGATIDALGADFVVFQQGPSSVPESQRHLEEWAGRLAPIVREAGGQPAFFMVWPPEARWHALSGVRNGYAGAAEATDGVLIPVGSVWEAIRARDPTLQLFGPDAFHPSLLGSAVAALTIVRVLFDQPLDGMPARLEPRTPGLPVVDLGVARDVVVASVEFVVAREGPGRR